jgi:biotin carboxylase
MFIMNQSKKFCAIVDPYSSSNLYAPALRERGYECIAVLSQAEPTDIIAGSFRKDDFVEVLKFAGDLDEIVSTLKRRNVELLIPGMEMGLELADALGEKMGSHIFNDPRTSHLRRHKFDMIEAVRKQGLKAPLQLKSSDLDEIRSSAASGGIWPLVVKPADSGGADRVFLCQNERELEEAFHASIGSRGRQGREIKEIVVQEFMQGTEYIVDTVSHQGRHMIVDIWSYHRVAANGAQFVYDTKELVPYEGETGRHLIEYTKLALDAVGIRNGPSHNEIMLTKNGPMLVEVNARFGGSMGPIINRKCLGRGQLDVMMDVLFQPERFLEYCLDPYEVKKHGLAAYFISKDDKHAVNAEAVEKIKGLPSYHSLGLMSPPGTRLARTVDMFTMPGMVELVHRDGKQILKDYHQIRELENSGDFYISLN